jgi:GNAT superfamily N-acetyltransferase
MSTQAKPSFSIRKAGNEDCAGILECLSLAFAPYRSEYTPDAYLDTVLTPETLGKRFSRMSVFVAIDVSLKVIGTIACHVLDRGEGYLRGMAVRPECQGLGVSQQLLERAEAELAKAGCRTIILNTTEPLKRAVRFYEKNGFRPTGTVRDFFGMPVLQYSKSL